MNENIKKFLEKVSQDPELAAKMSQIKDQDEAYKLASSVQDGFTKEEFVSTMDKLAADAKKGGDLSDEDLKALSGGGTLEVATGIASGAAATVSAIHVAMLAAI